MQQRLTGCSFGYNAMLQVQVVVGGLQQLCGLLAYSFIQFFKHDNTSSDRPPGPSSPLQGLTKLQTLHLSNGKYTAAQLPLHLTEACFTDCSIFARVDSACVTSLRKLQTVCSTIQGHGQ